MSVEDAVIAIRVGDVEGLSTLLEADPELVHATTAGNQRSLLHHATDWPGHWFRVDETIALLIAAGAATEGVFDHPDNDIVNETPLHWAASSGDTIAVRALLDGGAVIDVLGGIFGGCTPYEEAIIFEKYEAAALLLERGASNYLPGAAALGRADLIDGFFLADGSVDVEASRLPNWQEVPSKQTIIDRAFQFACRAGHLDIAKTLLERGADPDAETPANTTAIQEAVQNNHHDVARWLNTP